jgi:uncharacterized protein with PIN domain
MQSERSKQDSQQDSQQEKGRDTRPSGERTVGQRCDLCGNEVVSVRRVALDGEYDRLQLAHKELYACEPCFESKEQRRLGLNRR